MSDPGWNFLTDIFPTSRFVETDHLVAGWTTTCATDPYPVPAPCALLPASFERTPLFTLGKRLDFRSDMSRSFLPLAAGQDVSSGKPSSVQPYMACFFKPKALDSIARELFSVSCGSFEPRLHFDSGGLRAGIGRLIVEGSNAAPDSRLAVESISLLVIVDFLRSVLPGRARAIVREARHPGIRRAIARMEESFAERLTVDRLAVEARLSKSHFIALFRAHTGMTPHEYLRRVRVEAAKRLLDGGSDVTDACFSVGFSSMSGFEEAFRALAGMAPSAYTRAVHG
jgi:AraC-like DNA-binding protein